jgi:mono/diheme cytochrome c family protein
MSVRGWLPLGLAAVMAITIATGMGAQSARPASPGVPKTDQELRGEALFLKNCALCHIHTAQKERLKVQASGELIGLFQKATTTEAAVRRVLQQGLPGLMPTFQYALPPGDMDDVVAYLKIR